MSDPGTDRPETDRTATPGVELDGVSVRFGDLTALQNVSLTVEEGEFFTLVGPSGCGKTTTLRTIAGFETPSSGTVRIGGREMTSVPPEDRNVGVVFQNYALFPHLSVRENVAYGLRFHDPPGGVTTCERVDELLALVDMAEMAERDPEELSGGQQQRVALARALAPGPELLLLDEPLSALDARLRERLRVTVRGIQQDLGITTVYVTHDQAEALAVSDRVAVVNDGRIEQVDTPERVYRNPATRFVAEFVGDNNLFEARIEDTDPPRASVDGTEVALAEDAAVTPNASVTLCVRPEAIRVDSHSTNGVGEPTDGVTTLTAEVESREFLGDAYRVHCRWNERPILVKTDGREPPEGTVRLRVAADDVLVLAEE